MIRKNESERNKTYHEDDMLFLDKRQTSLILAGLIIFVFFTFVAGYFWGKKQALEQLVHQATYDSFADQAYGASLVPSEQSSSHEIKPTEQVPLLPIQKQNGPEYCALLAGFGSEYHAQQLVDRLARQSVVTYLKKRLSKTPRGKTITWYQVITKPYGDKQQLQDVVSKIQRLEKIKNVRIVEININGNAV